MLIELSSTIPPPSRPALLLIARDPLAQPNLSTGALTRAIVLNLLSLRFLSPSPRLIFPRRLSLYRRITLREGAISPEQKATKRGSSASPARRLSLYLPLNARNNSSQKSEVSFPPSPCTRFLPDSCSPVSSARVSSCRRFAGLWGSLMYRCRVYY